MPDDILEMQDPKTVNHWFKIFIVEARKSNGDVYPPKTFYSLLTGLLRHMRNINTNCPNFLAKNHPMFKDLHNTIDGLFRKLRSEGVGSSKNSSEPFSKHEEKLLFDSEVISVKSPEALLKGIFYFNCKGCCLRGGEEHRGLRISQFKKVGTGYIYTENSSKNRPGGFSQLNTPNKSVTIMHSKSPTSHWYYLEEYLKRLPEEAIKSDVFYLRPLINFKLSEGSSWFSCVPIGRNRLAKMTIEMCKSAGIGGHKTNHSLRATGATQFYLAGVPEKIIKERTGHKSLEALRHYENTSDKQNVAVSNVLSSVTETSFDTEMKKIEDNTTQHMQNVTCFSSSSPPAGMKFQECSVNITVNNGTPGPRPTLPPWTCSYLLPQPSTYLQIHIQIITSQLMVATPVTEKMNHLSNTILQTLTHFIVY